MIRYSEIARNIRNQIGRTACLITCVIVCGCSNDMESVRFFEQKEVPLQTVVDAHVDRSEYGRHEVHLVAPKIVMYGQPNQRTVYPEGADLWFYDTQTKEIRIYIHAGYAITNDNTQLTEAKDSVVIINYQTGDTSYLENLYWNAQDKRIYSDRPVRQVGATRVTYGDSFESDDNFNNPVVVHQRGTIEWSEGSDQSATAKPKVRPTISDSILHRRTQQAERPGVKSRLADSRKAEKKPAETGTAKKEPKVVPDLGPKDRRSIL